ncbi:MAG: TonB-dependent receptor, partial [Thiohalomonadaceae bacterium]
TWTGSMDLQRFYDYANEPRYNLDGTRKLDRSPSYWVVDLSGRYRFSKRTALVFGVNNLFDYSQTDTEDFLWVNGDGEFDVTHFWGPSRGRQLYAGVRVEL